MALCVTCAQPTLTDQEVCAYHLFNQGDDWATSNRIMCDFLHRGIVPPVSCELEAFDDAVVLEEAVSR